MKVYLVEDCGNSPGRVYAVMASEGDAEMFANAVEAHNKTQCDVIERELYYGQPPQPDYCP